MPIDLNAFFKGFIEKASSGDSNVAMVPVPQDMIEDMPEAEPTLREPNPQSNQVPKPKDMKCPGLETEVTIKKKNPESSQVPVPQDMLDKISQLSASELATLLESLKKATRPLKGQEASADLANIT